jgi:hypothetical protein
MVSLPFLFSLKRVDAVNEGDLLYVDDDATVDPNLLPSIGNGYIAVYTHIYIYIRIHTHTHMHVDPQMSLPYV